MSYVQAIAPIPPVWNKPSPTYAGLSGLGAATPVDPLATALSMFQVSVAKMVGDVVESVSGISLMSKGAAIEWGTNMNNFAASVVQSLTKKTGDGRAFWVRYPDKAKKLLSDAESFVNNEAKQYKAAAVHLLSIKSNLRQASSVVAKEASSIAKTVAEGAAEGVREGGPWLLVGGAALLAVWIYGQVK
jgi:hypothetical protein